MLNRMIRVVCRAVTVTVLRLLQVWWLAPLLLTSRMRGVRKETW